MCKYLFLTPNTNEEAIYKYYLKHIPQEECAFLPLYLDKKKKKTSAQDMKTFISEQVVSLVNEKKCKYILVCNGEYFKLLTKNTKVEPFLGYVIETDLGYVSYVPSYEGALYDPTFETRVEQALGAVKKHAIGAYQEPGKGIIHTAIYPCSNSEISLVLESLYSCDKLTCDIETWSLKHYDSGIASITFCWNEHEGTAFCVDYSQTERNEEVRDLLRHFFETYQGTLIFHNITFDMYILTYQLYMKDLLDTEGLLKGLEVLLRNYEDTKIIAYLATNSCTGNTLGLKALAQEFAGNYAQEEIGDVSRIPREQLLKYNLTDGLCTWYVYHKYFPQMVKDEQLSIYESLFKPAVKDIIQMQLTGLPLNMDKVLEAERQMEEIKEDALKRMESSSLVQSYMEVYRENWAEKRNKELKKKKVSAIDCKDSFNPDSSLMLKDLLFKYLNLPVIERTPSKEAATGKEVLAKLVLHTENQEIKDLLQALIDYKDVIKILTAFIPAFKQAVPASDGRYYLFGSQNSTGTVSGRYSSSSPNMAQMPSTGSKFAKLVKSCFAPPKGVLYVGLDFSSLEDRISALLTKDKNKLLVYTDHYDGHCLRAYSYYKELMPDITKELELNPSNRVSIINSIKEKYKGIRQSSKAPTFALT